jgi:hypothetical protein
MLALAAQLNPNDLAARVQIILLSQRACKAEALVV